MNPEHEKICRQVASLFALTTSSVPGEAEAAKDAVKRLVKAHSLTYSEVSLHGNELALKVMRSFWSMDAAPPAQVPPQASPGPGPFWNAQYVDAAVAEANARAEALRDFLRRSSYQSVYSSDDLPFGSGGSSSRGPAWGWTPYEPPLTVLWQGASVPVTELSEYALSSLINGHNQSQMKLMSLKGQAHDFIDACECKKAAACLEEIERKKSTLTEAQYQGLGKEYQRRRLHR